MSVAEPAPRLMTADEFMALPDDGRERWLVDGVVRDVEGSEPFRAWVHGTALAAISSALWKWLQTRPRPRGQVGAGNPAFRLSASPDTLAGPDVGLASAEVLAATPETQPYYEGAPTLAVEILSPWDKLRDILDKTEIYLAAGSVVWVADPYSRIVTIHQPGRNPRALGIGDEVAGEPYLPGFRVAVADLFDA